LTQAKSKDKGKEREIPHEAKIAKEIQSTGGAVRYMYPTKPKEVQNLGIAASQRPKNIRGTPAETNHGDSNKNTVRLSSSELVQGPKKVSTND